MVLTSFRLSILLSLVLMSTSKLLKVLVLHGKGASGAVYRNRLEPLLEEVYSNLGKSNVDFVFLDAPHVIEEGNDAGMFEWWRLPPGIRSFNAKEYKGIEDSLRLIERYFHHVFIYISTNLIIFPFSSIDIPTNNMSSYYFHIVFRISLMCSQEPYDVLIGHSQGYC